MDATIVAGSLLILLGMIVCMGLAAVVAVAVVVRLRGGESHPPTAPSMPAPKSLPPEAAPPPPPPPPPPPAPRSNPPASIPPEKPAFVAEPETTDQMPSSAGPPPRAPLLGFFDDELSGPPTGREAARTELFQRGATAFEWDDDDDDDEGATEVFSAHHMDELAGEFNIEDD